MPKPSEPTPEAISNLRDRVVGLGERSFRKSYFPQLQARIADLSRFRALLDQMSEGVLLGRLDDGKLTYVNAAGLRLLGLSEVPERWRVAFGAGASTVEAAATAEAPSPHRIEVRDPERDEVAPVEVAPSRIDIDGAPHVVFLLRDLRAQLARERQIRLLSRTLEQSPVSVVVLDETFAVTYVNERFVHNTGYGLEALEGRRLDDLPSGRRAKDSLRDAYASLAEGRPWEGELRTRRRNGTHYWERLRFSVVHDEGGGPVHYVGFIEDITERRRARERIRHLAFYDSLTGLPNRRMLVERLRQASAWCPAEELVAVHLLDLDHFKTVNDHLGHPMGDRLLREVGQRLQEVVREEDLVARLGGDEFAVVQAGAPDEAAVAALAARICEALRAPFVFPEGQIRSGGSVGVAVTRPEGADPDVLLERADLALYDVKHAGRATYRFYDEGLGARAHERAALSVELDRARLDDELELDYQPIFALSDQSLVGLEALVRWRHPSRGRLSPGEFISIAEDYGQIGKVGAWVLESACRTAQEWLRRGEDFDYVAVNLSCHQFTRCSIVEAVQDTLRRTGLPADKLRLEVTESMLMTDLGVVLPMLETLRRQGVRFAIDDFGTGYSSLLALRRLPIDALKIAQEFVRDMLSSPEDAEIVHASAQLAKQLDLTSVAEGAEDAAHLEALRRVGCDCVQGYALGRPRSPAALDLDPLVFGAPAAASGNLRRSRSGSG